MRGVHQQLVFLRSFGSWCLVQLGIQLRVNSCDYDGTALVTISATLDCIEQDLRVGWSHNVEIHDLCGHRRTKLALQRLNLLRVVANRAAARNKRNALIDLIDEI